MAGVFIASWCREIRHLRFCRWDLLMSTLMPVLLLVLMAVLFAPARPRNMPVIIVDLDHSAFSRMVVDRFDAHPVMKVTKVSGNLAEAWRNVRAGHALAVLLIPKFSGREVKSGRQAKLTFYPAGTFYTASVTLERAADDVAAGMNASLIRRESAALNPARAASSASLFAVQANTMFNPFISYEMTILTMLFPAILIILMSCAVVTSLGREFSEGHFPDWIKSAGEVAPALAGKIAPYVLIYLFYGCLGILWLGARGYPVAGSVWLLILGYLLMLIAYGLLAAMIVSVCRDSAIALGAVAVYASSALAFSGAFFPMQGAVLFTRSWNLLQPFTWMSQVIADIWQMGTGAAAALRPLSVLLLMCVVLGLGAYGGVRYAFYEFRQMREARG